MNIVTFNQGYTLTLSIGDGYVSIIVCYYDGIENVTEMEYSVVVIPEVITRVSSYTKLVNAIIYSYKTKLTINKPKPYSLATVESLAPELSNFSYASLYDQMEGRGGLTFREVGKKIVRDMKSRFNTGCAKLDFDIVQECHINVTHEISANPLLTTTIS